MKTVKLLLLLLGFTLLAVTIRSVGLQNIAQNISKLRWNWFLLLAVYPFIFAFDTLGWSCAFPKDLPRHVPFKNLYLIRVIGETLNSIIPMSASLGGEPVKCQLLKTRHGIPLSDGYASILIVHTTFWVSLNIFVIGGILVTLKTLPLTPILWHSVLIFLSVLGVVALLLVTGLHLGIFKKVHSLGETLKIWGERSNEKRQRFLKLDEEIRHFYTTDRRRFFLSVVFNFFGWFMGTFEVYLIARFLGMNLGFREAWLLEALIQVLRVATFFIPSSIGTQEGGIVLIFMEFGFHAALGLTFALIRRIREIIWIGIGLLLWSVVGR